MAPLPATVASSTSPALGLHLIKDPYRRYYRSARDCPGISRTRHPFGLDQLESAQGQILFLGKHATDMSVEALALWLSFHIDDTTSHKVTKLRIIILPRFVGKKQKPGEYYNFFEVWIGDHTILISGETTTFSGSGNEARIEFESIFALLSLVYNVPVVRVTSPDNVRIEDLYRREKRSDQ